jgi:group I intron endonuclease
MTVGIYKLVFQGTDKIYVGQSLNIEKRLIAHKSLFNMGSHSKKLQKAFDRFGTPTLELICSCEENELDTIEDIYIAKLNVVSEGFNTCRKAGGGTSLEGEDVGNAKFSNLQIEQAFMYLVYSPEKTSREIETLTGVSKHTIDAISSFKVHKRLERLFPEEYLLLRSRNKTVGFAKNKTLKDINNGYPRLVSPEGVAYIVDNCSQFSKIHGLNNAHVIQVLKGKERQHKGWTAETVVSNPPPLTGKDSGK